MNDDIMKIAICDDDPDDRALLAELTRRVAAQEKRGCELTLFASSSRLKSKEPWNIRLMKKNSSRMPTA